MIPELDLPPVDPTPRVLLADPDRETRQLATEALEAKKLEVWSVGQSSEAWDLVERQGLPHAAVVELAHPEFDGIEFCERVRRIADLPIIGMSWKHDLGLIVRSLEAFADDFVRKPFAPAELAARVMALLRRVGDFSYTVRAWVRIDDRLAVDFGRRLLSAGQREVGLTPTETKILYLLTRSMGHTIESRFLLARLWPTEQMLEETLRTHVYRLRSKLESIAPRRRYITTVRGVGYRFSAPGEAALGEAPAAEPKP